MNEFFSPIKVNDFVIFKGVIGISLQECREKTMTNDDIIILIFLCSLKLYYTYKYSIVYC